MNLVNGQRIFLWTVSVVLIGGFMQGEILAQESPDEVIQELLGLPHGFNRLSPDDQAALERVISSPEQYIPIIEEKMRLPEGPAELADPEFRLRYERAVLLLVRIGNDEAKRVLRESYSASYSAYEALEGVESQSEVTGFLHSVQNLMMDALGELGDKAFVEHCLTELERADYSTQLVILRYLGNVGQGDEIIQNALERTVNDSSSPLYQDPSVLQTIATIGDSQE